MRLVQRDDLLIITEPKCMVMSVVIAHGEKRS